MAHGIAQHHDGVSGTSKQHVAYDYAMRLNIGQDLAYDTLAAVLGDLVTPVGSAVPSFSFCPLMNVSVCPSMQALQAGQILPVVFYNHLPYERNECAPATSHMKHTDTCLHFNDTLIYQTHATAPILKLAAPTYRSSGSCASRRRPLCSTRCRTATAT